MRILLWFTLGFAGATAGCLYLPGWEAGLPWWIPAALCAAGCLLLGAGFWKRGCLRPGFLLVGLAAGLFFFRATQEPILETAERWDRQKGTWEITALDYGVDGQYGTSVEAEIQLEGKAYRIRFYCKGYQTIQPGDRLTGEMRLRFTTPGAQKDSDYYRSKGIFLIGSQRGELEIRSESKPSLRFLPKVWAKSAKDLLRRCFPTDTFPFVQALLLGDTGELDYATNTALKVSGIRHIVAISGLHVMILYELVRKFTGKKPLLTALLGIPALLFFAAMVGFTPSVTRASVMVGLMMIAAIFRREYDSPTALSFACLVMLLGNPYVLGSVSFQLSVASVAGILWLQPKISGWWAKKGERLPKKKPLRRLWGALGGSISVSLSALVCTTPLSVWYFGTVSLIAPLTNLLTVWLIAPVFYGILAVCLVGRFSLSAGIVLGKLLSWVIRGILELARFFARIPYAAVYTQSIYVVIWVAACYVLLTAFLIRKKRGVVYASVGACLLAAALLLGWAVPRRDAVRLTMLDVGQGQCLLLQSGGKNYLIDCGGDSDTQAADQAAQTLLSQGVFRLDGVILTHFDRDHCGGLENLLSRIPADACYLPDQPNDLKLPAHSRVEKALDGTVISMGEGQMRLLQPDKVGTENNLSVAVLFESPKCVILVTGDRDTEGEASLLEHWDLPKTDVLVAGHHGSRYSASQALLERVQPRFVLISVGENNNYGHPAKSTLQRLLEAGCRIFRTDIQGTILYRR